MAQRVPIFVFNRDTCAEDFTVWLIQFESYCKTNELDPENDANSDTIRAALLTCASRHQLDTIRATANYETKTYKELRTILRNRYLSTNRGLATLKFSCARLQQGEALVDFVARVRPLAVAANKLGDSDIIEKLIADPIVQSDEPFLDQCLKTDITIQQLLDWHSARETKQSLIEKFNLDKTNLCQINSSSTGNLAINQIRAPYRNKTHSESSHSNHSRQASSSRRSSTSSVNSNSSSKTKKQCHFCGYEFPHTRGKCYAIGKSCGYCKQLNHFVKCCPQKRDDERKTRLGQIKSDDTDDDFTDPLGNNIVRQIMRINTIHRKTTPSLTISIGSTKVKVMIDTGAEVDILNSACFRILSPKHRLQPVDCKLLGFHSQTRIPTLGKFSSNVTIENVTKPVEFIVVDSETVDNLISFSTILNFNLSFDKLFEHYRTSVANNVKVHHIQIPFVPPQANKFSCKTTEQHYKNIFPNLFKPKTGCVNDYEVKLRVDNSIKPIRMPAQKIPLRLQSAVKQKLDQWIEDGIIEPISMQDDISWVSSLNPVEKPSEQNKSIITKDDIRLTINCKNVNKAIIRENTTILPSQKEVEHDLANSLIFSKVDIRDAFSVIPLSYETSVLFTFATPWGLYRLKRLVQGVSVSSEIFHEYIINRFRDLPFTKACIDDFLIYGKPDEDCIGTDSALASAMKNHDLTLHKVLTRLNDLNVTLNTSKCQFKTSLCSFFGNEISSKGIRPLVPKMKSFLATRVPKNKSELHSFLGMVTYFHPRLPDVSNVASPLLNLLKKGREYNWTEIHTNAVNQIKDILVTGFLKHFDPTLPTELFVDAGPDGVSAILTQLDKHNKPWLINCASHTFTDVQKRYSQFEKEALGANWGCEHFANELLLNEFTLISDNEALCELLEPSNSKPSTSKRVNSWLSNLTKFTYKVKHVKGKSNCADFVSRCLNSNANSNDFSMSKTIYQVSSIDNDIKQHVNKLNQTPNINLTLNQIAIATLNDVNLVEVGNYLLNFGTLSNKNPFKNVINEISFHESGALIRNNKIILPTSLINTVLSGIHAGHPGEKRSLAIFRHRFYYPGINKLFLTYIKNCLGCQANTGHTTLPPQQPTTLPINNDDLWSIDFSSQLPNNNYAVVICKERPRFPIIKLTKNITAKTLMGVLEKIFAEYGIPKTIKSDNGGAFKSKELATFFKMHNIFHMKITPYWPNANGLCEGMMRLINKSIRTATANNENWLFVLDNAIKRYRAAPHPATGYSPNEMSNTIDEIGLPNLNYQTVDDNTASRNDSKAKAKNKSYADSLKHAKQPTFKVNDMVYFKWHRTQKHMPIFNPKQYKITNISGTMITAVNSDNHSVTRNCSFFKIAHNPYFKTSQIIVTPTIYCYMFSDPLAGRRERKERERLQRLQIEQTNLENQHSSSQTPEQHTTVPTTPLTTAPQIPLPSPASQTVPNFNSTTLSSNNPSNTTSPLIQTYTLETNNSKPTPPVNKSKKNLKRKSEPPQTPATKFPSPIPTHDSIKPPSKSNLKSKSTNTMVTATQKGILDQPIIGDINARSSRSTSKPNLSHQKPLEQIKSKGEGDTDK